MSPEDSDNFKIQFGVLKGTIEQVLANNERFETKLDRIDEKLNQTCKVIPQHHERIASLENSRILWNRFLSGLTIGVICALIAALFALVK